MDQAMLDLARRAMDQAYAPYSKFQVGAVVRGANGRLYAGCNVENAAYPQGCCAEASAISAMIVDGERLVTPCGGCRQRLREFARGDTPIHVCGPAGVRKTLTLEALLPLAFGPENLA